MKKLIIEPDKATLMNIDEVLEKYRGLAYRKFKEFMKYSIVSEDDVQELDVLIFKSFQSYDEKHCFSTHLVWKVRGYASNKARMFSKSVYADNEVINFDYCIEDSHELHEIIPDNNTNIEFDCVCKDLIRYIKSYSKPIEKDLIDVYLGKRTMGEVSKRNNTTPQYVSRINRNYKDKLHRLIKSYNRI